jgi:hypothetical protein
MPGSHQVTFGDPRAAAGDTTGGSQSPDGSQARSQPAAGPRSNRPGRTSPRVTSKMKVRVRLSDKEITSELRPGPAGADQDAEAEERRTRHEQPPRRRSALTGPMYGRLRPRCPSGDRTLARTCSSSGRRAPGALSVSEASSDVVPEAAGLTAAAARARRHRVRPKPRHRAVARSPACLAHELGNRPPTKGGSPASFESVVHDRTPYIRRLRRTAEGRSRPPWAAGVRSDS